MSFRSRQPASALGRPIDFNYSTNRAIVFLASLAGVFGLVVALGRGQLFGDSLLIAFFVSVATFWGWAITRELDPDNDLSAFVSAFIAFVLALLLGNIGFAGLLAGLLLLQGNRILNRIVGLGIGTAESIFVLIIAVIVALASAWIWLIYIAVVFLIDYLLPYGAKQHLPLSGIAVFAAIVLAFIRGTQASIALPAEYLTVFIILSAAFLAFIMGQKRIQSLTDLTHKPVLVIRVRWAQLTALGVAWILALLQGWQGFLWVTPLWASFGGIVLYQLWLWARKSSRLANSSPEK